VVAGQAPDGSFQVWVPLQDRRQIAVLLLEGEVVGQAGSNPLQAGSQLVRSGRGGQGGAEGFHFLKKRSVSLKQGFSEGRVERRHDNFLLESEQGDSAVAARHASHQSQAACRGDWAFGLREECWTMPARGRSEGSARRGPSVPRRTVMSQTGLATFDATLHATNAWLKQLMEEMGWPDRQKAYHALREVLHALRDRLPIGVAVALAAQMPMLLRGLYYEGWHPADKPLKYHRGSFLAHLGGTLPDQAPAQVEDVVRAVFRILALRVSHGEIEGVKRALPEDMRLLWPD
jgi:uncharacterized protein (DUF2267 family)